MQNVDGVSAKSRAKSLMEERDTIAAVATPPGRGGIGIVRLSGPRARQIAERVVDRLPPPHYARLRTFRNAQGEGVDQGLVLYLPRPGSFSGEDTVELQGHGGPVVTGMVLDCVLRGRGTARAAGRVQ